MTIEEKMNITTWRARQLAYLEELYAPREHMGKLMSRSSQWRLASRW